MLPVMVFVEIVKKTKKSKTTKKTKKVRKRPKRPKRPNRKSCDQMTLKTTNLVANDQKWQHWAAALARTKSYCLWYLASITS